MADYTLKLVDHTGDETTQTWLNGLSADLQKKLNESFAGSKKTIAVVWGNSAKSDNLIVHLVLRPSASFVQQVMPGTPIGADKGGHTRLRDKVSCSEIYLFSDGSRSTYNGYSKLALHEGLHNLFPGWTEAEMHNTGGVAASPPSNLTAKNKEMLRHGFEFKNEQYV